MPNNKDRVPNYTYKVPNYTYKVPTYTDRVPHYTDMVPHYSYKGPPHVTPLVSVTVGRPSLVIPVSFPVTLTLRLCLITAVI